MFTLNKFSRKNKDGDTVTSVPAADTVCATVSDKPSPAATAKPRLSVREMALFAMLAALMFGSKILMEALPNIHLLGMLTMLYTVVFRKKALIPIYLYVLINGIYAGFNLWWIPYLYIWTVLWGVTMLLPQQMPKAVKCVIYPIVCCLHGLGFGILYAPTQALMYGFNWSQTVAWVVSGFPFDLLQGIGNLFAGLLIYPLSELMKRLLKTGTR